jgi:glycosyltransferase involved in cell wall biosynthesis
MEPFDIVIGIFRPFSAISTTIQLKDDFPELVAGAYYLDLISGSNKPKLISKYLYDYLCKRGERRAFSKLDFILMAKEGENIYGRNIYSSVNKIINYVDFPMFVKTNVCNSNSIRTNSNETIFIYAGTLDKNYRNPSYMLELLGHLGIKIPNLTLHIFGKGDCSSIINKYRNYSSFSIIEHGFVEHEEVISAMKSADFIINIANTTENIVPSKIFELFSMGKPILNFVKNERDTSLKYFNKYPSAKIIKEWDKIENQMEAIQEFVVHEKDKIYTFEQIRDNFLENTPRHIVDKIEGVVERLSQLESKLSNSSTKLEQK